MRLCGIYIKAIPQRVSKLLFCVLSLKYILLDLQPHFLVELKQEHAQLVAWRLGTSGYQQGWTPSLFGIWVLPKDTFKHFTPREFMMTSSNGSIFRVTGPLCGEFSGPGEFPTQRPVTRSFDVSFDLRLNKRLSKQPRGWWFETPLWSLWRQCNVFPGVAWLDEDYILFVYA